MNYNMNYNINMYSLIATDLDETLLNDNKHVSKADIDTINTLSYSKLVIATGRGFRASEEVLKEIGQYNKPNTYIISFNGGVIVENKDNKILYSNLLSYEDVSTLFNIGLKYDICIEICALDCYYAYRLFENEENLFIKSKIPYKAIFSTDISFAKDIKVAKVLFCKEDMNYLKKIKNEINIDDKYSISFSSNCYMEINPKGISKGLGLKKLCEILDIDIKDTVAIGDNINDLSMIKNAGLGIGVKNTVDDLKPYCDLILDSTNNQNPITEIKNRQLIK